MAQLSKYAVVETQAQAEPDHELAPEQGPLKRNANQEGPDAVVAGKGPE